MNPTPAAFHGAAALLAVLSLSACATTQTADLTADPYEGFNRQMFAFNDGLDKAVIEPVAKGYRAVYEPSAIVYEEARQMTGFGRRVRIMAGNIQQLREIRSLLSPVRPLELFFLLGHKGSRLLVPFAMLTALTVNFSLVNRPLYLAILGAQLVFYLLACLGTTIRLRPKLLMLPYYFCMINLATFFGFYHALTHRRSMAWK